MKKACGLFSSLSSPADDHPYFTRYTYTYAWSLFASGQYDEAKEKWLQLKDHHDYRIATAAAFFLAKIYLREDKKNVAKKVLSSVKSYFEETKYGMHCMNLYNREF